MKTLFAMAVVLVVGIVALGFCRGWFQLSTDTGSQGPSATIPVDKDKIHEDEQKTKDNIRHFGQEAKEKVGDRTGKVQEPERRP
ncbi:MAG: hypothetical protein WCB27_06870 [Thermoguttaceae bacterium]